MTHSQKLFLRNITLLIASTMTVMAGATIAPALPDMEKAFHDVANAELLIKMVMTIPGLVIAVCAPLIGILLDKWQKKPLLIIAALLYGLAGTSGFFLSDSLYAILAGRVLLGVAVAGIMVGCTTLIADYFTGARRSHYMGLQAGFGAFGGVIFIAAGGVLADINWTVPFLIYLSAFIILPGLLLFINEPGQHDSDDGTHQPATITGDQPARKTIWFIVFCYFLALIEILVLYLVPVHYPFFINTLEKVSNSNIGYGIALMLLVMATTSSAYRYFKSYLSFQLLHGIGLLILATGYFLIGLGDSYLETLPGLIVAGVGLGIMRPNLVVWLMSFTSPQVRGLVMGGLTTSFFVGQFICPLLSQPIILAYGYASMFHWVGLALLLLALSFICLFLLLKNATKCCHPNSDAVLKVE